MKVLAMNWHTAETPIQSTHWRWHGPRRVESHDEEALQGVLATALAAAT